MPRVAEQQFLHIFTALTKSATCNASDDLEARGIGRSSALHGEAAKMLHACDLVRKRFSTPTL